MPGNGKLKIGVYWAASCGGCDVSLLEIGDRLLELLEIADVVFWPCATDFKYSDLAGYPDRSIDALFFNGGVRNTEQEELARLVRKKSRTLVAYGACAADGGIPALANLSSREAIFHTAYHDSPSNENPMGTEPQTTTSTDAGVLDLPDFYTAVLRLKDVVPVDYEIPGCPPQADRIWEVIQAVSRGAVPAHNESLRVGCTEKSVCDECSLEKRLVKIKQFRRQQEFRPEPDWCLLEQGVVCMGPATRGGCGALCLRAGMRCEGCYGPPIAVTDQGAAMMGAMGSLVDASTEKRAKEMVAQIPDRTGTFYRFTMSSSHLKARQ
jgi:F420-non-reducing hydrogenase small subunit